MRYLRALPLRSRDLEAPLAVVQVKPYPSLSGETQWDPTSMRLLFFATMILSPLLVASCGGSDLDPRHAAKQASLTIRVASLNCWGIPLVAEDWPARLKKLPAALKSTDVDIICLQEIWLAAHQKTLAKAMSSTHPYAAHAKGGLMTLSRWPITSNEFHAFPALKELSFAERLAGKGALRTYVDTPAGVIHVFNTHLNYKFGENIARTKQLGVLLNYVKHSADTPTLLAGDFNTPSIKSIFELHPQHQRILNAGFTDAYTLSTQMANDEQLYIEPRNTRVPWPRVLSDYTGWDPDHIYFHSGTMRRVKCLSHSLHFDGVDNGLSDHVLVRGVFVMRAVDE